MFIFILHNEGEKILLHWSTSIDKSLLLDRLVGRLVFLGPYCKKASYIKGSIMFLMIVHVNGMTLISLVHHFSP